DRPVCVLARAVETSQCEAQDCHRIYRDLRFGSLLLRTSQLAPTVVRNNNRPNCRRKITKAIVDLSRWQADQDLSNRARSYCGWAKAGRRRYENARGHLQNRHAKCAKQFSPRATHLLSLG